MLAGSLYGRERAEEPPSATPATSTTVAARAPQRARPRAVVPAKSVVESRILALAFTASKRYLPRSFVDARTGLPKSNVLQAVCARTKRGRGFDCALRMDGHRPVPVRYRLLRDGRSRLIWPRTGR